LRCYIGALVRGAAERRWLRLHSYNLIRVMPAEGNVTMRNVIILCLVYVCTATAPALANLYSVGGLVLDQRSQPIPRATVRIAETKRGVFTDARGWFRLDAVDSDSVKLLISCVGFVSRGIIVSNIGPDSILTVVLEETSVLSQGIVVTSYRAGERDPVTQTTVTREAIDRVYVGQDPQYILERTVPSVVAYSESGTSVSNYGTFRIRGMDQTRINVTLDGTPLNDMIDQGVFFSNMADLTNGMRSVQVQRGTGMSTNGTASYAGSVNFEGVSLAATQPSADVQLTGGSFGMMRASGAVSTGKMDNDVSVYARFTTLSTDGYRDNTGTTANSLYASASWFGSTDVVRLTVVWGRTQNGLGYLPVPKPIADANPRTNLNDSSDRDDFGQNLVQLQNSHAFSESLVLTTSLYMGGAGGDYLSGYRDTTGVLIQTNYPLENRQFGAMTTIEARDVAQGFDVTAGLHAYTFRRRNWETMSPETRPYYDDTTTKNEVSGFVRGVWRDGALEAFADLQLRHVNLSFLPDARTVGENTQIPDRTWTFGNPRLGVRYVVNASADVYASFGRTGREPTRFDYLQGSTQINSANLGVLLDPTMVRAEYVNDVELGTRLQSTFGHLNATAFLMMFRDEIVEIGQYIEQQFVQLRKNVPSSKRMGIEIDGSIRVAGGLWLDLIATWMRANINEYRPDNTGSDAVYYNVSPVLTPELQATATLRYRPIINVDVQASVRHVSTSYTDLSNAPWLVLPAFTTLDVRLSWTFMGRHSIGIMANNILNAFVVTNGGTNKGTKMANEVVVPTYFVQATRNFAVMLNLHL